MSNVDELILELFAGSQNGGRVGIASAARPHHDWDSASDTTEEAHRVTRHAEHSADTPSRPQPHAHHGESPRLPPVQSASVAPGSQPSYFDDDDDEDDEKPRSGVSHDGGGSARGPLQSTKAQKLLYLVPFPDVSSGARPFTCSNRCYVTNLGAAMKGGAQQHPNLDTLRLVFQGRYDAGTSVEQMMRLKGAFYVSHPSLGNGCLDHGGDLGRPGGCPAMVCLRCGYGVVRLQGAAWNDRHGSVNLYLTTRNYYPDWSRLASSYAVDVPESRTLGYVLVSDEHAAAYCCQCAWLTVRCERTMIETHVTAAVGFHGKEADTVLFATELPLQHGERRRAPLWMCRGHHTT